MNKYIDFNKIPANIKKIKIDIGLSNEAPQSRIWFDNDDKNNDLFIFGFEPNSQSLENLKCYFLKTFINENKFCLIPVALNNVEEPTIMNFYESLIDCGTSSLHIPIDPKLGPINKITKVPVYSLKNFFDIFDWERFHYIEYIKIDAQGSDYDILVSAGNYLKDRVVYITAEPEYLQYENTEHNNESNIKNYLISQGFIQINHPNTRDPTFINSKYIHLKDDIYISQI